MHNASLHYYVGPARHTKQGVLLYNPKTKLVIIRRSFQHLDLNDLTIPQLPLRLVPNKTTQELSLVTDLLTPSSSTLHLFSTNLQKNYFDITSIHPEEMPDVSQAIYQYVMYKHGTHQPEMTIV